MSVPSSQPSTPSSSQSSLPFSRAPTPAARATFTATSQGRRFDLSGSIPPARSTPTTSAGSFDQKNVSVELLESETALYSSSFRPAQPDVVAFHFRRGAAGRFDDAGAPLRPYPSPPPQRYAVECESPAPASRAAYHYLLPILSHKVGSILIGHEGATLRWMEKEANLAQMFVEFLPDEAQTGAVHMTGSEVAIKKGLQLVEEQVYIKQWHKLKTRDRDELGKNRDWLRFDVQKLERRAGLYLRDEYASPWTAPPRSVVTSSALPASSSLARGRTTVPLPPVPPPPIPSQPAFLTSPFPPPQPSSATPLFSSPAAARPAPFPLVHQSAFPSPASAHPLPSWDDLRREHYERSRPSQQPSSRLPQEQPVPSRRVEAMSAVTSASGGRSPADGYAGRKRERSEPEQAESSGGRRIDKLTIPSVAASLFLPGSDVLSRIQLENDCTISPSVAPDSSATILRIRTAEGRGQRSVAQIYEDVEEAVQTVVAGWTVSQASSVVGEGGAKRRREKYTVQEDRRFVHIPSQKVSPSPARLGPSQANRLPPPPSFVPDQTGNTPSTGPPPPPHSSTPPPPRQYQPAAYFTPGYQVPGSLTPSEGPCGGRNGESATRRREEPRREGRGGAWNGGGYGRRGAA
ncbi:hypothetical protein JCM6882_008675 [Rhodosporidiobolus microsporus]